MVAVVRLMVSCVDRLARLNSFMVCFMGICMPEFNRVNLKNYTVAVVYSFLKMY